MPAVDSSPAGGNRAGVTPLVAGQRSISAASFNALARATNASQTIGANGAPSMSTPYGNVVGAPKARSTSFAFPFQVKLKKVGEEWKASVAPGTDDGVLSAAFTPATVVDGHIVYAISTYADAYKETPTSVTIAVAASANVPESHDTQRITQLASVAGTPLLKVAQFIYGGLPARAKRSRRSFDATRQANLLRIDDGYITALINPSTVQTVNTAVALAFPALPPDFTSGTLICSITVTRSEAADSSPTLPPATFTVTQSYAWGEAGDAPEVIDKVNNTDQGLFVGIDAKEIIPAVTTIPGDPKTWAAGTLSPEFTRPTTVFRIPICDLTITGGSNVEGATVGGTWLIRQRQCGDIQLPLQTNWGWPATPPDAP